MACLKLQARLAQALHLASQNVYSIADSAVSLTGNSLLLNFSYLRCLMKIQLLL